jgi:hypothetical protein
MLFILFSMNSPDIELLIYTNIILDKNSQLILKYNLRVRNLEIVL